MIELRRMKLEEKNDMDQLNAMMEQYYAEICTPDELRQEIADLYDEKLNAELIEQTRREKDPYYFMSIEDDGACIGFVAYTVYQENKRCFINNFYIAPALRNRGLGSAAYRKVEQHSREMGALVISLLPEERAVPFYRRLGFSEDKTANGEPVIFRKIL